MQQAKHYSQQCTSFTHNLSYSDIPEQAVLQMKGYLLDFLGCAIKGYTCPQALPAKKYISAISGAPQASLIGQTQRSTMMNGAFFHGYLGHILEMDDVDRESITHPAAVVIPAALAVSEKEKKNGEQLLTAMIAGYEVMLAIGAAITPAHYKIWHTTGTAGAFGAAMAAGKLFDLKPKALDWALGNAGTMASGLWQFLDDGAMSKFLHTAKAAENGVLAAYLASENFTGSHQILEGKRGFFAGFARQEVDPAIFEQLGQRFRTATVSIKPYPCCRHTHSSIDAAEQLRQLVAVEDIESITIETYSNAVQVADNQNPQTTQEAKFSLTFCVASTLLNGLPTDKSFTVRTLYDPATRALMEKIKVTATEKQDAKQPRFWPSRLEATVKGRNIAVNVDSPKGDPDNPLSWLDIVNKFEIMTEGLLTPEGQRAVAELCFNIEALTDVSEIIQTINRHALFER